MPLQRIVIAPGLVLDDTEAASEGRWVAADKIRFEDGRPQTIGGWEKLSLSSLNGTCRSLLPWIAADTTPRIAFGEHDGLEALVGGQLFDITPSTGFTAGSVDGLSGAGFGTGAYSSGTYGTSSGAAEPPMVWSLATWGSDLLASPRGQGLFEWSLNTASPAAAVSGAPSEVGTMFVTPSRFVVLLGTKEEVSGDYNPRLVRWCDQEDNTGWTTTATGEAGEIELQEGSALVGGMPGVQENLVWSDTALYAMRQTFDDLIWQFPLIGRNCGLIAKNAAAAIGGRTYWMGHSQFYVYSGGVPEPIDCPLDQDIFKNLAPGQAEKVFAAVNEAFSEIWWFYPDFRYGNEINRYALFNVRTGIWSAGTFDRTAWAMSSDLQAPVAANSDGEVFIHETGLSGDGGLIGSYIRTGMFDLDDGEHLLYIKGAMADVANQVGGAKLTIYTRETMRSTERVFGPYTIAANTERIWFEAIGRFASFRFEGVSAPECWRLGDLRFDVEKTGMRM